MIDRGISEEYLVWWLNAGELADHAEQRMKGARIQTRHRPAGSLVDIYTWSLAYFGSQALAAEFLRRVLQELAEPTPVDDSLPPPDSPIWRLIVEHYANARMSPNFPALKSRIA